MLFSPVKFIQKGATFLIYFSQSNKNFWKNHCNICNINKLGKYCLLKRTKIKT